MTAEAAEVVLRETGKLSVTGMVTIDNVVPVTEHGIALFDREDLVVDLAQVTDVDSSAVSMLLQWQREASRGNRQIHFANVPQKLQSLIQLYSVSELIHWSAQSSPDSAGPPEAGAS